MILGVLFKVGCSVMAWVEIISLFLTLMNTVAKCCLLREQNQQAKKRKGS